MATLLNIAQSVLLPAAIPLLAYLLCAKVKLLKLAGPTLLCFAAGIGLSFLLPELPLAATLSDWCVNLSIPLLLFGLDMRVLKGVAKSAVLSFVLICFCVVGAGVLTFVLFGEQMGAEAAAICSTLSGLFVGGLVNMAAVGSGLGLPGETLTMLNTSYLAAGAVYLAIAALIIPPLARLILPKPKAMAPVETEAAKEEHPLNHNWRTELRRLPVFLLAIGIVLLSMGISYLITGNTHDAIISMLCITTFSVGAAFIPGVREARTHTAGQYLIDLFCVTIGMAFDFSSGGNGGPLLFLLAMLFVQVGAALLHLLLARIFRIDADTALMTSFSALFSPVFIPPLARFTKTQSLLPVGLVFAVLSFVVANYAGFLTYALLLLF